MTTENGSHQPEEPLLPDSVGSREAWSRWWSNPAGRRILVQLSSPKITVFLIMAAIVLVLVGTLAQVQKDIWEVVTGYFRAWFCWVELKELFPTAFFPWAAGTDWNSLPVSRIPFPGGALVGLALVINLAAALTVRFPIRAKGVRLMWGLVATAVGAVVTWLVIELGHNRHGVQGKPPLEWSTLWGLIRTGLAVLWFACVFGLFRLWRSGWRERKAEAVFLGASAVGLIGLLAWIFVRGDAGVLTDSSLRILYQLIQGEIAALALLVACVLLFRDRAGNALMHGGVALMMFGEFFVSQYAEEQQMTLVEGQTVNYTRDTRSVELAIRARRRDREDLVRVPMEVNGRLTQSARGATASLDDLPFDVDVVKYFRNSRLRMAEAEDSAPAGSGPRFVAEEVAPRSGVQRGQPDLASAYVQLTAKATGEDLGTFLVSQHLAGRQAEMNTLTVRGKEYSLELRYKQSYKPYQITLLEVRKDDYAGTAMARNYSSRVKLVDPSRNAEFEAKIWMNNPLRYAGETFYQSGYNVERNGKKASTLQVVKNTGWMIPYVSCMIVSTGMLWHFLLMLLRFLRRTPGAAAEAPSMSRAAAQAAPARRDRLRLLFPAAVAAIAAAWVAWKAMPAAPPADAMQLDRFGALPMMYEGRIKPFDTLARNNLRIFSGRETFVDGQGNTQPAIRWLLDVIARPEAARKHRVFRFEATELYNALGLERRKGARYSWAELNPDSDEFRKLAMSSQRQGRGRQTFQQRKIADLAQRVDRYETLAESFHPMPTPALPTAKESAANAEQAAKSRDAVESFVQQVAKRNNMLLSLEAPLAAPAGPADQPWLAYAAAQNNADVIRLTRQGTPSPATAKLTAIFEAYRADRARDFNDAVADYEALLAAEPPTGLDLPMTQFEAFINRFAPFYNSIPLYAFALALTICGWLTTAVSPRWSTLLRSGAFWLIVVTFLVHTFALGARVAISGRPPVTNLYSTAIFIGWGCVAIGLAMEGVFRLGFGNLVSAVAGIGTLIIAHFLAGDGDTIRVLQAVLDTQFWLTVHVLTITLGYSAMFFAGLLGLASIACRGGGVALSVFRPRTAIVKRGRKADDRPAAPAASAAEQNLDSMIYSAICFAAFFSLVGTVLGGLWADDSWGRFWGWDPKENGALIIVLWTALVLHARLAHMVTQRGMALLAVGGNIITSWSWFGVNELGVGLHAYGFTEGVAGALLIFWATQLAVIGATLLPTALRWFFARRPGAGARIVVAMLAGLGWSALGGPANAQSNYVGDRICANCHDQEYAAYKRHGHPWMSVSTFGQQPPVDLFPGGVPLPQLPLNTVTGQQMTWSEVAGIFGNFKDGAGYLIRASDGKYVASGSAPNYSCLHCHDVPSGQHLPPPNGALQSESCAGCHHRFPAVYSPACFRCHNTGFDPNATQYGKLQGGWTLDGIQCEHCHGAAAAMQIPDKQICRDCHSAGDPQFRMAFAAQSTVLVGGTGFTGHHAEGDEYRASPHKDLGCVACHDPHRSVWHDDGGVKFTDRGSGNMCSHCHKNRVLGVMGQMGLECVDCHMPMVSSKGNRASHLFRINTTELAASGNTYQADGKTWWNVDAAGNAFLTLDLVCGKCHANMSLQQMAAYAKRVHHKSTYVDLTVNGADLLQTVRKTQTVSVDFSVRALDKKGVPADWSVLRQGPTGWASWNGKKWVCGLKPWRKKVALADVPSKNVFKAKLTPGYYTFWINLVLPGGTQEAAAVPVFVAK